MAKYGLQTDFANLLMSQYFCGNLPQLREKEIFIGLGLTQQGAAVNIEGFNEVFGGKPYGNYRRARAIFGKAVNCVIKNDNEIIFSTASEDWTDSNNYVEMLGIFDTLDFEDEKHNLIKPLIVLHLPNILTVIKGETLALAPNTLQLSLTDI